MMKNIGSLKYWEALRVSQTLIPSNVFHHPVKAKNPGPVVQNFVGLMLPLIPQFVNYMSTSKANTL